LQSEPIELSLAVAHTRVNGGSPSMVFRFLTRGEVVRRASFDTARWGIWGCSG
jgi:hypothetical protein